MKTIFKKRKGQKAGFSDNVQKAILRTAAVIISFVLISLTVSAQDFWKNLLLNSSFNEIALALTDNSEKTAEPKRPENSTVKIIVSEKEETLVLEEWMTNGNLFGFPPETINTNH